MRCYLLRILIAVFMCATSVLTVPAAQGRESYYAMIFAAEGRPNIPRLAHTFAVFVKVQELEDVDRENWPIEIHTISWLPATLNVRLLFRPPERGVNLDLQTTLRHLASQNAHVCAWGPFQIRKELFDRALMQIERLNAGAVAYKAMDRRFRPCAATNCFHAVSDIVDGPLLGTGTAFGVPASRMVVHHLTPWFIEPQTTHRDLLKRLGLENCSIVQ